MAKLEEKTKFDRALAPFTIKELRDSIPPHCFERSLLYSSLYIVIDVFLISVLVFISHFVDSNGYISYWSNMLTSDPTQSKILEWIIATIFWNCWWFMQGGVMTGLWVIAHECGHQSFSQYKSVNHSVGFILHSLLMVPYHSWRITHGIHHKSTSHMDRDQVYIPKLRTEVQKENVGIHEAVSDSPLVKLFQISLLLLVGWPFYLGMNAWGQNYGRRANHFEPTAPMFKKSQKMDVIISDIGVILMLSCVIAFSVHFSFMTMLKFYGMPYLWVNFWLIFITYLQHTDNKIPHYRGQDWNFIRGALCTIDRDYGFMNKVLHHIGDTHVAHHMFSQMPHYHAEEATLHLKKVLGEYYMSDNTPMFKALWKSWSTCHYVDDEGEIVYYKKVSFKSD